jgi:hypothetical protein
LGRLAGDSPVDLQKLRSPAGDEVLLKPKPFIEDVLSAWMLPTLDDEELEECRRLFATPGEDRLPIVAYAVLIEPVTQQAAEQGISYAAIVAFIGAVDSCRAQATWPRQKARAILSAGPLSTRWSITSPLVLDACRSCHVAPWTEISPFRTVLPRLNRESPT